MLDDYEECAMKDYTSRMCIGLFDTTELDRLVGVGIMGQKAVRKGAASGRADTRFRSCSRVNIGTGGALCSFSKVLAVVLSIVFAVLVYMGGTARAEEAPSEHAAAVVGISADPSTAESNILGTAADGGRYIGRVWTDKSVFTDGTTLDGTSLTKKNADDPYEFLTVFSARGRARVRKGRCNCRSTWYLSSTSPVR